MYKQSAHTNTHTPQHPSQEWRCAAETRAQAHTPTPHTPARRGRVQAERAHKHTHAPKPQPGVAGRSRNPSPNSHAHTAHPSQEWRGTGGARTRTPHHPSQERRGAAETRAQTHTPTPHTPARSGGVQAECAHKHTDTPTPQPEVAGRSRDPSPSTHTHTAHPSQEWRGTSGARTRTPQHPSREWRGAAESRAQAHTPTPHTPARNGEVQAGGAHKHTHTPTPQPGVAWRSRNLSPNTHTHIAHPGREWRGTSRAGTQADTHPNTAASKGGALQQPEPKHTRRHRTPQPGVAG